MDAITILKNESNSHRIMQIDIDELALSEKSLDDVYDLLAIELRRGEETVSWEDVKKQLIEEGKL